MTDNRNKYGREAARLNPNGMGQATQEPPKVKVDAISGTFVKAEEEKFDCYTDSFGNAILALKAGNRVARKGWNGKDMYLELQTPDENSKMSLPYIYMKTVQGDLVPWLASQTDILSEDWCDLGQANQEKAA